MSVKLAVVVLIALQASLCLAQLPEPDKDLTDKYDNLKATLDKRVSTGFSTLRELLHPLFEDSEVVKKTQEHIQGVQDNAHYQSLVKIATGLANDAKPLVASVRQTMLGLYSKYLRPYIGSHLDQGIKQAQSFLDMIVPVDKPAK